MKGEVESHNLQAMKHMQAPSLKVTSRTGSRPVPRELRKSVNWARPLATMSSPTKPIKRITTRLQSGKGFTSCKDHTCSGGCAVIPGDNFKEPVVPVLSSEEMKPIRIIGYHRTRRGARKHEAQEAGPGPEPPKELPKYCSTDHEGSNSKMQKRAHTTVRGGEVDGQLHGDVGVVETPGKDWVAVPLSDEAEGKGSDASKNRDHMVASGAERSFEKSSFRLPENVAKATEADRKVGLCSFNAAWQDKPEVSKKKLELGETHDASYKELCDLLVGHKRVVHHVEHNIHVLQENQLKKLRREKAQIEAAAVLEQERLRGEIAQLSLKNSRIFEEKLALERDRVIIQTDYSTKLERAREALRSEIDEEHAEIVKDLTKELGKEQEKTTCQICFNAPRDAIILPCMHFQYCKECLQEHQRRLTECPTCRTKINGVLCCNLCTS